MKLTVPPMNIPKEFINEETTQILKNTVTAIEQRRKLMNLQITEDFLTVNPYSRSGYPRTDTWAVVLHWVANPGTSAKMNRDYFESLKAGITQDGKLRYAGTQYIVGLKGEIIQCMPDNEIAYHVGSSQIDPASGKIFTDLTREMFGTKYTTLPFSPSYACIGIEMCHPDWTGKFNEATLESVANLTAVLFKKYGLTDTKRIITHNLVVGWKNCPKWFVDNPAELDAFRLRVAGLLAIA